MYFHLLAHSLKTQDSQGWVGTEARSWGTQFRTPMDGKNPISWAFVVASQFPHGWETGVGTGAENWTWAFQCKIQSYFSNIKKILFIFVYFKGRVREWKWTHRRKREWPSICWFTPQMHSLELFLDFLHGWQWAKHLSHKLWCAALTKLHQKWCG